jgi:hypothetical protein
MWIEPPAGRIPGQFADVWATSAGLHCAFRTGCRLTLLREHGVFALPYRRHPRESGAPIRRGPRSVLQNLLRPDHGLTMGRRLQDPRFRRNDDRGGRSRLAQTLSSARSEAMRCRTQFARCLGLPRSAGKNAAPRAVILQVGMQSETRSPPKLHSRSGDGDAGGEAPLFSHSEGAARSQRGTRDDAMMMRLGWLPKKYPASSLDAPYDPLRPAKARGYRGRPHPAYAGRPA